MPADVPMPEWLAAAAAAAELRAGAIPARGTGKKTLQPRDLDGDGVVDAFYDAVLNITWLRDASALGPVPWEAANAWARTLRVGGLSGWRLPSMVNRQGSLPQFSFRGSDCGYNVRTASRTAVYSEMAHLWYVTLGNQACYDTAGARRRAAWGLENTGDFLRLKPDFYWTGARQVQDPSYAWHFHAHLGCQHDGACFEPMHAMAVRPGDAGAAPASAMAPASGLAPD